jgi:hypothetical protein
MAGPAWSRRRVVVLGRAARSSLRPNWHFRVVIAVDGFFGGWLYIAIWKLLQRLAHLKRLVSALQMLGEGGGDGEAGVTGEAGGEVAGERAGHFKRAAAAGG